MYASMRRHILAVALAVVCTLAYLPPVARAAYQIEQIPGGDVVVGDFVVGPTKLELTLEPGTEKVVELMVTNRMGERRQFNLSVEDTKGSDDPNQAVVLLGDDRGPYSLKDYLKFPEATFELGQGERARIPVTVQVPADAQPGGLYGTVIVSTASLADKNAQDTGPGARAGSVIVNRIGALFFVAIPGAVDRAGMLDDFKLLGDRQYFSRGPIDFQILFRNTGSIHLAPSGIVTITNMLGEEVGEVIVDPWFAFPQSLRLREIKWDRPYLFGKYTAEAKINRGYDNLTDTASVTFYVLPWTLIGGGFVALVLVFFIFRFIGRTFQIRRR